MVFLNFLFCFLWSLQSTAIYIENRDLYPIGEKEALMANTGVALSGSTGSVYYNPAGLLELPKGKVSLSGNSYVKFSTRFNPMEVVDDTNLDFTSSGIQAVPSTLVSTRQFESFAGAFSVLVPEQTKLQDMAQFQTPNFNLDVNQMQNQQLLLIGLSAAKRFEFADVGISCFWGNYESVTSSTITVNPKPASGYPNVGLQTYYNSVRANGILCHTGLQKNINNRWRIGLAARAPFILLSSSGKTHSFTQSVTGDVEGPTLSNEDPEYKIPAHFSLGNAYKITDSFEIFLDVSYQLATSFRPITSVAESVETKATWRESLGVSYILSERFKLYGGFGLNPSTMKLVQAGDSAQDFQIYSLGLEWTEGQASLGAGIYIARSNGDILMGSGSTGKVNTNATAAVITSGFLF